MAKDGKALTNLPEFGGKAYKAGDKIPAAVLAGISPQVLRALVDGGKIEVAGMEQSVGGSGGQAHIMARLDKQDDQIKGLLAANKEMSARLAALEGKTPAKVAKAPKAK